MVRRLMKNYLHHNHWRRGRGILLWAVFAYCLGQVLINVAIDGYRPELRSAYLVDIFRKLDNSSHGPDMVCVGTSRFGLAFTQEVVEEEMRDLTGDENLEVFNASIASQDFHAAEFIMRQVLKRGHHPSLAVIEVNPETVACINPWLGNHVMPPVRSDNRSLYLAGLGSSIYRLPNLLSDRVYPLYRCRREIWSAAGDALALNKAPPRKAAQRGGTTRASARRQATKQDVYERFLGDGQSALREVRTTEGLPTIRRWLKDYRIGGLSGWSLERLIRRCRAHGMTVILASAPVTTAQRQLYTSEISQVYLAYMKSLEDRYGCTFVDLRDAVPDDCFHDNHHVMIPQGSTPFSRRLAREILAPAWLRKVKSEENR